MRDFPVFTTQNGVASLVLREVPYSGTAYITLRDSRFPRELLEECVDFCKAVGAEKIYAAGHELLLQYPFSTAVWRMNRSLDGIPDTDAALFPVTDRTLEQWRGIYNEKMADVPNAATMTREDGNELLKKGNGYFVHRNGELLGIGIASGEQVDAVIATKPGAGEDVLLALCHALAGEQVILEVASENLRAIRLYDRLGFLKTAEISRWYDVSQKLSG